MQLFFLYLFLRTLYMFQAVPPPETCRVSVKINKEKLHLVCCNLELYFVEFRRRKSLKTHKLLLSTAETSNFTA
jgi:hypothetical protein